MIAWNQEPFAKLSLACVGKESIKTYCPCGDIKQVFLQIRISDEDRDVLRFLWVNNKDPEQVREFRFIRAVFGLVQSSFLLEATLALYIQRW